MRKYLSLNVDFFIDDEGIGFAAQFEDPLTGRQHLGSGAMALDAFKDAWNKCAIDRQADLLTQGEPEEPPAPVPPQPPYAKPPEPDRGGK